MTKNRKNRHDRRPYIQRLFDFTKRVAEQTLPDGEKAESVDIDGMQTGLNTPFDMRS